MIMTTRPRLRAWPLASLLAVFGSASADEPEFSAGATLTVQTTTDRRVDSQALGSVDLGLLAPMGPGFWAIHVEGSTTVPDNTKVAALLGEANADAGSALDAEGNGRLQLSELNYTFPFAAGTLSIGLMDTGGFLDTSEIANDETAQFINANLVNNPTIGSPDYTLGMAWVYEGEEGMPSVTLLAARSHGLADDYPSYSSLFDGSVDVNGDGINDNKGVFAGAELGWCLEAANLRLGVWTNTADHPQVSGTPGFKDNAGLYAVADGTAGETLWGVRAGWADHDTSEAVGFLSGAVEFPTQYAAVGLGLAHTWANADLGPGFGDTSVAEVYARFEATEHVQITPSIQWIGNANFDSSNTVHDDSLAVFTVRAQVNFQ